MAYNPGIERDDEQEQGQEAQDGTNQLAGGGGVITGQGAGQAQKQKGSGFVNIGQYLNANQQDLAGQADKAIGKVNEGWGAANEKLASSSAGFNAAADQNRVTLGDASTTDDDKEFASNFLKNSKLDANDQGQFASWQNMGYQGPTTLENTWGADQKKSDDLANTLQSSSGYFPAMEQVFGEGRSDYGTGAQRLDASLMSADKGGRERIDQNTQQRQQELGGAIQSATTEAQAKANQYKGEADSGRMASWDALNSYMPTYAMGLADQVGQTNAQRRAAYEAAMPGGGTAMSGTAANSLYHEAETGTSGVASDGRLEEGIVGYIHPESLNYTYTDPRRADFVSPYGGDVGLGSLNQDDLAKMEALFGLSGDANTRQSIESDIAGRIGVNDIYRDNSSTPISTFDQSSYDIARQQAINAAIEAAVAEELSREQNYRQVVRAPLQTASIGNFVPGQTFIG